jgi:FkbH-like protein
MAQNPWAEAYATLREQWQKQPNVASAAYIVSLIQSFRDHLSLIPRRLAILRSFTVEPVVPLVRAGAFVNGIDLTVQVGQFNAYVQEILNKDSSLYSFVPDIVILAVQTRDLAPELWSRYTELTAPDVQEVVERIPTDFDHWIKAFRSQSNAYLILHTLEAPHFPSQGILDWQSSPSQVAAIQKINDEIRRLAAGHTGVYILDYDALIARHGRAGWHDERKWLTARMPIAADHLKDLADEWLRFIHPLIGKTCKALVTDLDNTLWGGVIGEDGMEGISLGVEYPGAAFQAVQRVMLDFYQRGVLLAVCSKNNLADAMEALEKHPGMLLKPEHFAAWRINWNDKAVNLREIATELNIGVDSLAFLDDNPVERERIRSDLPEVTVLDLPDDPMEFARVLRQNPVFERLTLSDEDRERGRYYAEQRQRLELERSASSLEDFFRSLRQEIEISSVKPATLTRVAQLTQKTNQFNLTTRRYSEQQIAEMAKNPAWGVYTVRVKDRLGDNGLVGVVITHDNEELAEIDTFLLSCRVVGRTIETAILSFLIDQCRQRRRTKLQGWFLPTKKNDLAKELYAQHKFQVVEENGRGTLWSLDLDNTKIISPEWIQLTVNAERSIFDFDLSRARLCTPPN